MSLAEPSCLEDYSDMYTVDILLMPIQRPVTVLMIPIPAIEQSIYNTYVLNTDKGAVRQLIWIYR